MPKKQRSNPSDLLNNIPNKIYKLSEVLKSGNSFIGLKDYPTKEHPRFTQTASYFYYYPIITHQKQYARGGGIQNINELQAGARKMIREFPYVVPASVQVEDPTTGEVKTVVKYVTKIKAEQVIPNKTGFNGDYSLSQRLFKSKNVLSEANRGEITLSAEETPVDITEEDLPSIQGKAGLYTNTITCTPTNMANSKARIRSDYDYKTGRIKEFIMMDYGAMSYIDLNGNNVVKKINPVLVPVKYDDSGIDWKYLNTTKDKEAFDNAVDRSLKIDEEFINKYRNSMALNQYKEDESTVQNIDKDLLELLQNMSPEDIEELKNKKVPKKKEVEDLNI